MLRPLKDEDALAIATYGLRKVYGKKIAVEDLTISVGVGEVFGFLGPNGAGKTTAIKMFMGLVSPTGGSALLLGQPLGDLKVKEHIGFLPEQFRFHDWLNAEEFLHFHGQLYGMSLERRRQRVPQVLEVVGLSAQAHDKLHTFSKGMLQRIGLAQALLHEPSIVFLDEPTSGLDPLGRRHVRDIIRDLKANNVTVFLNSHLLSEVELVCDRVAIINKGRIIRAGLLEDLLSEKLELQLRVGNVTPALLQELAGFGSSLTIETAYDRVPVDGAATAGRLEELSQLCNSIATDGTLLTLRLENPDRVPLIAEAAVTNQGKLYGLSYRHVSLEELFVEAVEGEE